MQGFQLSLGRDAFHSKDTRCTCKYGQLFLCDVPPLLRCDSHSLDPDCLLASSFWLIWNVCLIFVCLFQTLVVLPIKFPPHPFTTPNTEGTTSAHGLGIIIVTSTIIFMPAPRCTLPSTPRRSYSNFLSYRW